MRSIILLCAVLMAPAFGAGARISDGLARPDRPKVEIRGKPGKRTIYYWLFARNDEGHSRLSEALVVNNAPETLSEENAVVLTPYRIPGATHYGILTSRARPPRDVHVEVKAEGERTFYYWLQSRRGRSVWSPLSGPFEAAGCAEKPKNILSWKGSEGDADRYYLYRTRAAEAPLGWRSCLVLSGAKNSRFTDTQTVPLGTVVRPQGNPHATPTGTGHYLLGTSTGGPIVDDGSPLQKITFYNFDTTDPANSRFAPVVKNYPPAGDRGAFQFDFTARHPLPRIGWDHVEGVSVHQRNLAGGANTYPLNTNVERQWGKNSHVALGFHQFNHTASQKAGLLGYVHSYGVGDNAGLLLALDTSGQNRTPGDEGTEFFSFHMRRRLSRNHAELRADAARGDTLLPVGDVGHVAAGRGIVNLSRAYSRGRARVEQHAVAVGTDTAWEPRMEGWWISFEADTVEAADGKVRQWYRVERYLAPDRLQLRAYTYWNHHVYKGRARRDGAYLLCPYAEILDGDARTDGALRVTPLTTAWSKGDRVEAIAGPQTTFRLGWWDMQGEFLPQDHVAGLGISYGGNKPPSEGALIVYGGEEAPWPSALECHDVRSGVELYSAETALLLHPDTPVALRVLGKKRTYQLACADGGLRLEETDGTRWVELGPEGIRLHEGAGIRGTPRTRGRKVFTTSGKATRYVVRFPAPYETLPFMVADSNQPIAMGVERVSRRGFTVRFAEPPPAGKKSLAITWMVQE